MNLDNAFSLISNYVGVNTDSPKEPALLYEDFDTYFLQWRNKGNAPSVFVEHPIDAEQRIDVEHPIDATPSGSLSSLLGLIGSVVEIIGQKYAISPKSVIEGQKSLMTHKQQQYGDAVLNPVLYCVDSSEIPVVVRGLINQKLNRIKNQTDQEDSWKDLLGYLVFMLCLSH